MPLPDTITWYRSNDGSAIFEGRGDYWRVAYLVNGDRHLVLQQVGGLVSIPLTDCHEEIGNRVRPHGPDFAEYHLRRSAFIQERALELYLSAVRAGIDGIGSFYGVIQDHGDIRAVEPIWSNGRVVYLVPGTFMTYHRVGLVYSPVELLPDPEHMSLVEPEVLGTLPITVLERVHGRDVGRPDSAPMQEYASSFGPSIEPTPSETKQAEPEVPVRLSRYEREPVI